MAPTLPSQSWNQALSAFAETRSQSDPARATPHEIVGSVKQDATVVPLLVTLGYPEDDSFNLRFPAEYGSEICGLLDEHGLSHGSVLEFSAGQELWIEAVRALSVPGGLAALAAVIKTVAHRHDGKRFLLERDGEQFKVEAVGFSEDKVSQFLEGMVARQATRDAEWQRVLRSQDATGAGDPDPD